MMIIPKVIRIDLADIFHFLSMIIIFFHYRGTHRLLWVRGGYIGLRNPVCPPKQLMIGIQDFEEDYLVHS